MSEDMQWNLFGWVALLAGVGCYFLFIRGRDFSRAHGIFVNVVIALVVAMSLFVFLGALYSGVYWIPLWQIAAGYVVWRGGRNIINSLLAGTAIPIAAFGLLSFILVAQGADKAANGWMIGIGTVVVMIIMLAQNWSRDQKE